MRGVRVNQNEIDQTAGVVYQAAREAVDQDNPLEFSIRHYEDPHINLGRGLEELEDIPSELQFRRPGGGGYVEHDETFCYGVAIPKDYPKQGLKSERNELGFKLEEILNQKLAQNVSYEPKDGDIYLGDSSLQVLGVGAADIDEDFGNATVVRGCMYPEIPSSGLYQHGEVEENVASVDDIEDIIAQLEDGFGEAEACEFVTEENSRRARNLQEEEGYRPAQPCFSRRTS